MKVYRLCREKFENDLSGRGAKIAGGRWNSKGTAILYTSESRALCTVESAVHIPLGILPLDYKILTIEIPDSIKIETLAEKDLPIDWKDKPPSNSTQKIGDKFIKNNSHLVLKVPSVVVQGDFNYLINPSHSDFDKVRILNSEPFFFDERLFK